MGKGWGKGFGDMQCRYTTVLVFGVIQLIMGICILGLGAVAIAEKSVVAKAAPGIWGGLWVGLTGVLGICGGLMKKKGLCVAFMVLSILSAALIWWLLLIFSLAGSIGDAFFTHTDKYNGYTTTEKAACQAAALSHGTTTKTYADYTLCENKKAAQANFGIFILSIFLLIFGIVSSSVACCAVCRCCGATTDSDSAVSPSGGHGYGHGGYA